MVGGRPGGARGGDTLHNVMREPGRAPDVIVLEREINIRGVPKVVDDPKQDLWLTTVDGRHQSPIIEIRVGQNGEIFNVHADILKRGEYFKKCLDGNFREGNEQVIDLPEEDPATFSFVIAWLYEGTFMPVKALSSVLVPEIDKGKGREVEPEPLNIPSSSSSDSASDSSARSQRIRARAQTRRQLVQQGLPTRQKQPRRHRPTCRCSRCIRETHCSSCGNNLAHPAPRLLPPNGGLPVHPPGTVFGRPETNSNTNSISLEDVRTALLTYNLSIQVYILADRYLLPPLKSLVSSYITDLFETFGLHFSQPSILNSLLTLAQNLPFTDPLLKKIFARIGLLSSRLWREHPDEMGAFFVENPEVGAMLMKETVSRVEKEGMGGDWLLPMDGENRTLNGMGPPPPPIIFVDD